METSLNIDRDMLHVIREVSLYSGISVTCIIKTIIKSGIDHCNSNSKRSGSIKYQTQIPKSGWLIFHINLNDEEYNRFLDIRNRARFSVSNFLWISYWLYGVTFLNKIIQSVKKQVKVVLINNIPETHKTHFILSVYMIYDLIISYEIT